MRHFLQIYSRKHGRAVQPLSPYCLQHLEDRDWPGDIRELENLINRYVILGSEETLTEDDQEADGAPAETFGASVYLRQVARAAACAAERRVILQALDANQGNRKKTARLLSISYRSLLYKIKDTGIPPKKASGNLPPGNPIADSPDDVQPAGSQTRKPV